MVISMKPLQSQWNFDETELLGMESQFLPFWWEPVGTYDSNRGLIV